MMINKSEKWKTGKKNLVLTLFLVIQLIVIPSAKVEGEGFFEPPALSDSEVFEILKKSKGKEAYPEQHVVVVTSRTYVSVEESGLSHNTERRVLKVLDSDGIPDASVLRFDYDPATQFISLKWVKIYKADGKVIEVDKTKIKDLPQPLSGIYWPMRMKLLGVTGLQPGDAVAYEVYKKGFQIAYLMQSENENEDEKYIPPMKGHYYDVFLFEETVPVEEKRYEIHIPHNKPFHWEIYNGEVAGGHKFDEKIDYYFWYKKDMPAIPDEKRQPDRSDFVTKLVLATVKDWKEKSVWFFKTNEPMFIPDEEIKKKVGEIVSQGKTDREKVKLLLRWVAHNIRYAGITMGKGEGYTLHSGKMTFEDRCGVCKDIAGMLITMMRAAGYKAYPAMTMAGARVENIPADQFNHCVVAWEKGDGKYEMLDPTWMPFDMDTWSRAEGEQDYLIGSEKGEDLMRTQPYKFEDNIFEIWGSATIDKEGNLDEKIKIEGTGYADTRMRRALAYKSFSEGRGFYQKLLSTISPVLKLKDFKNSDYHDLNKNFYITANYSVKGFAAIGGKGMRFKIPLSNPPLKEERWSPYLVLAPWKERKNPAMFWFPQMVKINEVVKIPSGFVAKNLPWEKSFSGDFVEYNLKIEEVLKRITYSGMWKIKGRVALKKDFEELDDLVSAIDEARGMEVLMEIAGKNKKEQSKK